MASDVLTTHWLGWKSFRLVSDVKEYFPPRDLPPAASRARSWTKGPQGTVRGNKAYTVSRLRSQWQSTWRVGRYLGKVTRVI